MNLMNAASTVAAAAAPPTWWATPAVQTFGTLLATSAGVWIGAWLVTRRESRARDEKRNADALFLAVTVSGMLERFVSDCADIADDDGTWFGQRNRDGELVVQVPDPSITYADLDVEWKSLPGEMLDRVHSIPRKLHTINESLKWIEQYQDEDDYFSARQIKFAGLGLAAASVSEDLRKSVNLSGKIDPDSNTFCQLKDVLVKLQQAQDDRGRAQMELFNNLMEKDAEAEK